MQFQWTSWPHNIGPVVTYVANCGGDCKSVSCRLNFDYPDPIAQIAFNLRLQIDKRVQVAKSTLKFVKIEESGINFSTQVWATGVLMANNNTWTTTVPKTLAPGKLNRESLLEVIAQHVTSADIFTQGIMSSAMRSSHFTAVVH